LFHYDSDKTVAGRSMAWELVSSKLSESAFVVFDDIQDNEHFRSLIKTTDRTWKVFKFKGKYLGMLMPFTITAE